MNTPPSPPNPQDRPPQFSMKMLLLGTAGVCTALAMFKFIGPLWTTVVVWMTLLVGAHVFANAWGTRRRGQGSHEGTTAERPDYADGRPVKFAPTTRLGRKSGMAMPILVTILSGALLGCFVGVRYLLTLDFQQTGYTGLAIGTCSFAFIGGFLGFMAGTFLFVSLGAFFEALRGEFGTRKSRRDRHRARTDIRNPSFDIRNKLEATKFE